MFVAAPIICLHFSLVSLGRIVNITSNLAMEVRLKTALKNYYIQLETTERKLKEVLENLENPVQTLINLSKQYHHVTSKDVDNAEICDINDLRDRLVFKIRNDIELEVAAIANKVGQLRNCAEDLHRKFNHLESVRSEAILSEPNFNELVDGTPYIPRLNLLMQWSIESYTLVSEFCERVSTNFKDVDYLDPEKVEKWAKYMNRESDDRGRVKEILGFTVFLIEGPV
ncbi:uncharacterized protein [Venturia canescens]|uniref:uncharacterized protein n=1 Tax=Venturia canescens TaxID=32260 RepID=UPI001C9C008F|nr:uncharacterized protein LOC122417702 [Venturia canescens]